jgi:hypothetical protein
MTERGPEFDELVGTDLSGSERERLHRVHELLVQAGPPPEWKGPTAAPSPPATVLPFRPRGSRRRVALVALAAALVVAAFGFGYVAGGGGSGPSPVQVVAMTGTQAAAGASASLDVYKVDSAGNWPLTLTVARLLPAQGGKPYELWLTKGGKLAELCASFRPTADGRAVVPMNVPYRLKDYDGWVVVEEGSTTPLLTTA